MTDEMLDRRERERWRLTDEVLHKIEEAHKTRCRVCGCEPPWHYKGCIASDITERDR